MASRPGRHMQRLHGCREPAACQKLEEAAAAAASLARCLCCLLGLGGSALEPACSCPACRQCTFIVDDQEAHSLAIMSKPFTDVQTIGPVSEHEAADLVHVLKSITKFQCQQRRTEGEAMLLAVPLPPPAARAASSLPNAAACCCTSNSRRVSSSSFTGCQSAAAPGASAERTE